MPSAQLFKRLHLWYGMQIHQQMLGMRGSRPWAAELPEEPSLMLQARDTANEAKE
jgi:hypothetical protein